MVLLAAKLSADAGNGLAFGSDDGLYGQALATPPRTGTHGWSFDNSAVGPGVTATWFQPLWNNNGNTYGTLNNGAGMLWPFTVARRARLVGASVSLQTGGSASTLYNSLFSSDPVTGLPSTKISDWFWFNSATAGAPVATVTDSATVLQPFTLYYVLTWVYTIGAYPQMFYRTTSGSTVGMLPRYALPTAIATFQNGNQPLAFSDTSVSYSSRTSAPATVAITASSATLTYAPLYGFQLINV